MAGLRFIEAVTYCVKGLFAGSPGTCISLVGSTCPSGRSGRAAQEEETIKKLLITTLSAMALAMVIVLVIRGAGPLLVLFAIALALLLIFALGNPPRRREDITSKDKTESVHRALGVQGAPDAEDLRPPDEPAQEEPEDKSR